MPTQTLPAPSRTDEQDTEPMRAVHIVDVKRCGICGQPATAFVCEYCNKPLCEEHRRTRRIAGEDFTTCPAHTIGGA